MKFSWRYCQFFVYFAAFCLDGRTSKHAEYNYATKCQTFAWKCQISLDNTRNMLGQKFM